MFQFNRYQHPDEVPELHAGLNALCAHYEQFHDHAFMARRALDLLERHPGSLKLLLVNLRLQLWCQEGEGPHLGVEAMAPVLRTALERRLGSALAHFAQQEILGVLGEAGAAALAPGLEQLESARRVQARVGHAGLLAQAERPLGRDAGAKPAIYFLPAASGFFSTLENVLLMAFYTELCGGRLVLAPQRYWWRYGLAFDAIFGDLFEIADESQSAGVNWYTRDSVAQWLAQAGAEVQGRFFDYKCQCYPQLFDAIADFLRQFPDDASLEAQGFIAFLRGGDKFSQETVAFPHRLIESMLDAAVQRHGSVQLLSDDWRLAESLARVFPGVRNITQPSSQGHQFASHVTAEDVLKILRNFHALCTCAVSAGCPSSNLVNAANVVRLVRGREVLVSRLFPVPAYLLL
ncbi:MAG: hypothetical protein ACT4NV_06005 [Rhodoferax sp.]